MSSAKSRNALNGTKRPICTTYYGLNKKTVVKTTRAAHVDSAIPRAVWHMQVDEYGSTVCEVHDLETGTLYAAILKTPKKLIILYKREVPARSKQ